MQLQRVEFREPVTTAGNGTTTTNETVWPTGPNWLGTRRCSTMLPHSDGDVRRRNLSVGGETAATYAGENHRVPFLLYRGDAPARPIAENACGDLHLWVEAESGSES